MIQFAQDLRYALRSLSRSKAVAATAILSLALGIGANTAIFSLVNAVLLRQLPVPNPSELAEFYTMGPEGRNRQSFSWPMFEHIRAMQPVFSGVFAWWDGILENFEANGVKYAAGLDGVSGEYFSTLGVQPLLGRLITTDDVASGAQVAVLSYNCWQSRYAGDRGIIGKRILIAARPMTIVGVTPKSFQGLNIDYGFEATVPVTWRAVDFVRDRTRAPFNVAGRLRPGVSMAQARAAVQTQWPSIQKATLPEQYNGQEFNAFFSRRIDLDSAAAGNSYLRQRQSHSLLMIMALVGAVLLIACVNLANLMLARAAAKEHETHVRIVLGAGPWQLARRWIAESIMLSSAGAALGLASAFWTTRFLLNLNLGGDGAYAIDPAPDLKVLVFTLALTVVTALLFSLAPALSAATVSPAAALQRSSTRLHGRTRLGPSLLVSAQIALAMVLVNSAALLVRSLENMRTSDLGFRRDHMLTMQLFPQPGSGRIPNRTLYYQELADKLHQLPGVQSVSYSYGAPASRGEYPYNVASPSSSTNAVVEVVGPGLFAVLGMRVLAGREFDWHDDQTASVVAVISESLARDLFPNQDPIGRTLEVPEFPAKGLRVVGVVNSASLWLVRHREPRAVYLALLQQPEYNQPLLTMRTSGDPLLFGTAAQRVLESLGHHFAWRTQSVDQRADWFLAEDRTIVVVSASFGALALLLAGIGLYGVVSHAVARRIPEIGIRMAVGASKARVFRLVMGDVLGLALVGLAVGVPATVMTRGLIGSFLFGVGVSDPSTLAASIALLIGITTLAGSLPARRAMRVDPMTALRAE